jgi:hypothetical protein
MVDQGRLKSRGGAARSYAWLSKNSDLANVGLAIRLPPGTPYGTAEFNVDRCGRQYTHHTRVDFALDSIVPEDGASPD